MMSYFKQKELMEKRGAVMDRQETLLETAKDGHRDLTDSEQREFKELEEQYNTLTAEIEQEEKRLAISDGREFTSAGSDIGGRKLNASGTIRSYEPGEKMARFKTDSEIGLGDFLRAAVDKPQNATQRDVLNRAMGSSGYEMPTYVAQELIDLLRASNPVVQAGAQSISVEGLDGVKFVQHVTDPTAVWHAENNEEDFSDPVFSSVTMAPKTVMALTEVSRELLQDSQNIQQALTNAFVGSLNKAILDATFTGSGGTEPTGLATLVTQEQEYSGDVAYTDFVRANKQLFDANVPMDGRAHLLAPDVWETLNVAEAEGQPKKKPFGILDIPEHISSGVPETFAYAGDFRNCAYGWRLNISLEQHQGHSIRKYASVWAAIARLDFGVFRPSAMVRVQPTT